MCDWEHTGHGCTCILVWQNPPEATDGEAVQFQCGCWLQPAFYSRCPDHQAPVGAAINSNPNIRERLVLKKELQSLGYDSSNIDTLHNFILSPWKYRKTNC
jgi:hypothetical protein